MLSSVQPARTINTSLRFLTNVLSAELALDLLLHNRIITQFAKDSPDDPKCNSNDEEPDNLVDEIAVCKHDRSITQSLIYCIVAVRDRAVVVGAVLKDRELLR